MRHSHVSKPIASWMKVIRLKPRENEFIRARLGLVPDGIRKMPNIQYSNIKA